MNLIFSICALIYISAIIYFDILKLKQLYINSLKLSIIENKLIEKEIDLLLTQIKPHFLYNTLTTIQSMIKHNPNMAYLLIGNLSTYLKNNMDYINNDHLILFSKEIKHIKTYIAIEKARFGKKINVIYDIQTDDFKVPTLSIQPLVENAIKHGITQKSNGGKIIIRSFQTPNFFIIQIIDDGKGFDTKILENKKHSIGIKNIKFRLKVICNASINITSKIGIGTTVLIKIPKIKRLGVI
ncbi:sensor histidine kinase [Anaerovorax odorimutans]|uniref:sensor histidine kinase n=1 Tax=Anaerovorax odorimutans TaxID=109327 RepID=UPI00146B35D6|nr:histidine kinase [Anaerovorax odorimutans]